MRALIYVRVSTAGQEDGTSLDSQIRECINYAHSNGYEVAHVAKEVYSGAYLLERDVLTEQRDLIRQNKYDALIAYSIDRLSRDLAHLLIVYEELKRFNTQLLFVTEKLDDSPQGKLLLSVNSYVAEVEREKIRERTMRGRKTKLLKGEFVPAGELYGYTFNRDTKKREINEEALIVREIFDRAAKGEALRSIIRYLNEIHPPPSFNKREFKDERVSRWRGSTVRRIIRESAYAGTTFANRFKRESFYKNGKKSVRIIERPKSEWLELPDTTPAIVTKELFDLVNHKFPRNTGEATRNEKMPYLLRGLAFCAVCGKKMYPEACKGVRGYRCGSRDAIRCGSKRLNADYAEKQVWRVVTKAMKNPQQIEKNFERRKSGGQKQIDTLKELQTSDRKLSLEIETLVTRAADVDSETWNLFKKQIQDKQSRRTIIQNKILELENSLNGEKQTELITRIRNTQSKLDDADFKARRIILEAFNVRIYGQGKEFDLYADWVF